MEDGSAICDTTIAISQSQRGSGSVVWELERNAKCDGVKTAKCEMQRDKNCEIRNAISQFAISQSWRGSGNVVQEKLRSVKCAW